MNKELFATALIRGLGLGVTQARLNILFAWFEAENTKAQNNPLATTWVKNGSTFFNCLKKDSNGTCKVGVQNFPSESVGVKATIDTLKLNYYKPIIEALKEGQKSFDYNNEDLRKSFSTWGTGYNNFLGRFVNYGTVTGKPTSKPSKTTKDSKGGNTMLLLGAAALAYGAYKYSQK